MVLRKNKVTNVFWVIFLLVAGMGVYFASTGLADYINMSGNLIAVIGSFLAITLVTFLVSLFSIIASKINTDDTKDISILLELVMVFMVAVLGFLIRFVFITMSDDHINGISFFIQASDGSIRLNADSTGAYLVWGSLLKGILKFVGPDVTVGLYIQVCIQVITLIVLYLTVRTIMGKIQGFVAIMFYFFLPASVLDVFDFREEKIFTLFFVISLYVVARVCNLSHEGKLRDAVGVTKICLAGVVSGFTLYLDQLGLVLLAVAIIMFFIYTVKDTRNNLSNPFLCVFIYLLSTVITFFFSFWIVTNIFDSSITILAGHYISRLVNVTVNYDVATLYSSNNGNIFSIIPLVVGGVWVFRLHKIDRDHGSYFAAMPLLIILVSFLGWSSFSCNNLLLLGWCIWAGIGFTSLGKNSLYYLEVEKERKELEQQKRKEELEQRKKEIAEKNAIKKSRKKEAENRKSIFDEDAKKADDLAALEATLDFLHEDKSSNDEEEANTEAEVSDDTENVAESDSNDLEDVAEAVDNSGADADFSEADEDTIETVIEDNLEKIEAVNISENEATIDDQIFVISEEANIADLDISTEDSVDKNTDDYNIITEDTQENIKEPRMVDGYYLDDETEDSLDDISNIDEAVEKGDDSMFGDLNRMGIKNDHAVAASLPTGQSSRGSGVAVSLPVGKSANPLGGAAIAGPKALPTSGNSGIPVLLPSSKQDEVMKEENTTLDTSVAQNYAAEAETTEPENVATEDNSFMEETLMQDTVTEESVVEEYVTEDSVIESAPEVSMPEESVSELINIEEPVMQESIVEIPAVELPVIENETADENVIAEPAMESTVVEQPSKPVKKITMADILNDDSSVDGEEIGVNGQIESENGIKTNPAIPPEVPQPAAPSIPIVKYGRRMDYRTAVVTSRSSNSSILSKADPMKPQTISVSPAAPEKKVSAPIHNPLPTPKKHVARELDFDVNPSEKDMHFDIVDLRGRDYFDIN